MTDEQKLEALGKIGEAFATLSLLAYQSAGPASFLRLAEGQLAEADALLSELRGESAESTRFLAEIARELQNQDLSEDGGRTHATAHPVYLVEQRVRIYGVDSRYAWHLHESGQEIKKAWLGEDGEFDPDDLDEEDRVDFLKTAEKVGYVDRWEIVPGAVSLTRSGIEAYIEENRHNLCDPRAYVGSAWRVGQTIRLIEELSRGGLRR